MGNYLYRMAPIIFNVSERISWAVDDGVGLTGNTIGEIIVLRSRLGSPTETGKNKTEGENKFMILYKKCFVFYHLAVILIVLETRIKKNGLDSLTERGPPRPIAAQ